VYFLLIQPTDTGQLSSTNIMAGAAHTPASILAAFYKAETEYTASSPEQRDFTNTGRYLSPTFRSIHSDELPWGGVWEGHDGFKRWMEQMFGRFRVLEILDPEIFQSQSPASNRVVVLSTIRLIASNDDTEWIGPLSQSVEVSLTEGLIEEIRVFWGNTGSLNKLLGHAPL